MEAPDDHSALFERQDLLDLIEKHLNDNPSEVALSLKSLPSYERLFVSQQISGRQKARKKFPSLFKTKAVIYPKDENIQQASSEYTAREKFRDLKGEIAIDLSSGFGIDGFAMSQNFKNCILIEPNFELHSIQAFNTELLVLDGLKCIHSDAITFLKENKERFDLAYFDPSRRTAGRRTPSIEEYEPNPLDLIELLKGRSKQIMIKFSPGSDISALISKIQHVQKIKVISVNNECKEVDVLIGKSEKQITMECVDIMNDHTRRFEYGWEDEKRTNSKYSNPLKYLYIPMSSLTKAGGFNILSLKYDLFKISPNTHIYTSDKYVGQFPGRIFKVKELRPYQANAFKGDSDVDLNNIICRNFKDDVHQITKKLKLKRTGDLQLIACRDQKDRPLLIIAEEENALKAAR